MEEKLQEKLLEETTERNDPNRTSPLPETWRRFLEAIQKHYGPDQEKNE